MGINQKEVNKYANRLVGPDAKIKSSVLSAMEVAKGNTVYNGYWQTIVDRTARDSAQTDMSKGMRGVEVSLVSVGTGRERAAQITGFLDKHLQSLIKDAEQNNPNAVSALEKLGKTVSDMDWISYKTDTMLRSANRLIDAKTEMDKEGLNKAFGRVNHFEELTAKHTELCKGFYDEAVAYGYTKGSKIDKEKLSNDFAAAGIVAERDTIVNFLAKEGSVSEGHTGPADSTDLSGPTV